MMKDATDEEMIPCLINKGVLSMMYNDKNFADIEAILPYEKLKESAYNALLEIRNIDPRFRWEHYCDRMEDYCDPFDNEIMSIYFHKIYLYKDEIS